MKLRIGIDPAGRRSDAILESILALAGLPAPLDRYMEDTGGMILRFRKPVRAEPKEQPTIRLRKVSFEASFHAKDVGLGAAVAAITKALVDAGLRAAPASTNPARQVFVREWHGWTSFGEVAHRGKPIDWGKAMSRALASPVLEVLSGGACSELRTYVDRRVAASVQLFSTSEELVVDPALLAPFGVKKKLKVRLPLNPFLGTGDVGSALHAVGAALGLERPVLAGSIKGQVLTFE